MTQVPRAVQMYRLDISVAKGRRKVREEFLRHSHVRDPRVIDMLVIKVCVTVCVGHSFSLLNTGEDGAGGDVKHVQTEDTHHEVLQRDTEAAFSRLPLQIL